MFSYLHIKISSPTTLHFRPIRKFNSLLSIHEDSKENEDDNDAETETRTSGLKGHRKAPDAPKTDVDTKHLRWGQVWQVDTELSPVQSVVARPGSAPAPGQWAVECAGPAGAAPPAARPGGQGQGRGHQVHGHLGQHLHLASDRQVTSAVVVLWIKTLTLSLQRDWPSTNQTDLCQLCLHLVQWKLHRDQVPVSRRHQ